MIIQIMLVPFLALLYLALLFGIAAWGDRTGAMRMRLDGGWTYTLSLGVFVTAWTYFGAVGQASVAGVAFLPIFLGPTLAMFCSTFVLHKMLRIAKAYGITSIADFLAARYGKSSRLGGLATIVALVGLMPSVATQLKAVAMSLDLLVSSKAGAGISGIAQDTALYVAISLAFLSILFGTRQLDATERHQGLMLAIAFESLVKLLILLAVGCFVVWGIYQSPSSLFRQATDAGLADLLTFDGTGSTGADWLLMMLSAGLAFLFLPRQFQVSVIENKDPIHLARASWAFPAYLLLAGLFVLPLALASRLQGISDGDLAILHLPLLAGAHGLAIAVFLGGLSAAAAMVVVETLALATMVSNDLVVPILLRTGRLHVRSPQDPTRLVLATRRITIVLITTLGYVFFRLVGKDHGLADLGMISLVAAAQFGPPILLGMYWRDANRRGALVGLLLGFGTWIYTLLLPTFAVSGMLDPGFLAVGPWGIELLRPYALFAVDGLHPVAHATLWSLLLNVLGLVLGSLLTHSTGLDRTQAELFVDVWSRADATRMWRGEVRVRDLVGLLQRFIGHERTSVLFAADQQRLHPGSLLLDSRADARLVQTAERQLARAVGSASARALIGSMVKGELIGSQSVMEILDETSQLIRYSRELERKSAELERATADLRNANDRLRELDQMKDDFMATVSHELRTPLTSIRAFSEIVRDNPDLTEEERENFMGIVTRESERLTRLINDILDLSKIEAGRMRWRIMPVSLSTIVKDAASAVQPLLRERDAKLTMSLGDQDVLVHADPDRLQQVILNLISNACKFVNADSGHVHLSMEQDGDSVRLRVEDDGPGVPLEEREAIFGKFVQLSDGMTDKPEGTGLGLSISRQIIEAFGGSMHVEDSSLGGAAFVATLRPARPAAQTAIV
ncbi:MAG TPA: sensor histidine kinase [Geminicoccus sp.]|jgi:signal transduction histidine kinase|uniref:sensor histidine kinase n=1 Tax=Geminicoccus sp. TaxID=2024832 RepID=UPI002E300571|nr:sensor histidine kinase [Geminicoccus sp.]HEX2527116.1 sensor histidine kinase [Geminicoccus sp.]